MRAPISIAAGITFLAGMSVMALPASAGGLSGQDQVNDLLVPFDAWEDDLPVPFDAWEDDLPVPFDAFESELPVPFEDIDFVPFG